VGPGERTEAVVFYSWQSDLPSKTNRTLIEDALRIAADAVKADGSLTVDPVVDRDTQGLPGSPDIGEAIFDKINRATAFVCDVSFINQGTPERRTPNPNVLVELGYALRALSWERIVMVLNLETGAPEDLPFDLKRKRVLPYRSAEADSERAPARKELASKLTDALRAILHHDVRTAAARPTPTDEVSAALEKGGRGAAAAVQDYMEELARQLATANLKPRTGELLVQAIESQTTNVLQFLRLARKVASGGEQAVALAMHHGFARILEQYQLSRGISGSYYATDFDLPKFIGHELFTSFAALLIKRGNVKLLGDLLRESLLIDADGRTLRSYCGISAKVDLLGVVYERKRSPQGEMLKARHTGDSDLAREMPWRLFAGADYFLYLYSMIAAEKVAELTWPWVPWSFLHMLGEGVVPEWLSGARSRRRFVELCDAFGMSAEDFRKRYGEMAMRADQFFPPGMPPLGDLPGPQALGSVP
jgi:hypothetical protein